MQDCSGLIWRSEVLAGDIGRIRALVAKTGYFSTAEEAIAAELVDAYLQHGRESGYRFVLAEAHGALIAYACYGPIPATLSSFDLYWIVVDLDRQRRGIGRATIALAETAMRAEGATRVYADTSSTERYQPTRAFYRAMGYRQTAKLADFYRPGDGKIIFEKVLSAATATS